MKYWQKGGIIGLVIGMILNFTPVVYFTILWRILLGDTLIARYISWATLPITFLVLGILIGLIIGKVKGK